MKNNPRFKLYQELLSDFNHDKALELACQIEKETEYYEYHKLYPLIRLPKTENKKRSWYVSEYELYPIYEPAEGGYYYNGVGLSESREFSSRKKAQRFLNQCAKEIRKDFADYYYGDSELYINKNNTFIECKNKTYIGQGFFIQLERYQGKSESGRQPYC